MTRRMLFSFLMAYSTLATGAAAGGPGGTYIEPQTGSFHPEQLFVRFRPGITGAGREAAHQAARAKGVLKEYRSVPGLQLVRTDKDQLSSALAAYKRHPDVLYAEPDYLIYLAVTPNDPDFPLLWGMENTGQVIEGNPGTPGADIRATQAWDFWTGDPDFKIAVVDTGVDYRHPELGPNMWTNPGEIPDNGIDDDGNGYIDDVHGYDFASDDSIPLDAMGHGSHVAGTICAVGDNGIGVVGVNWHCNIVSLKIFVGPVTPISGAVTALQYCIDNDIKVSNHSWMATGYSQPLWDVIEACQSIGHIVVAAAGNSSANIDVANYYPAAFELPNIISVAATDNNDQLAYFSNWGTYNVDLGAPGVLVYSTTPYSSYKYYNGTSMATPHVAGAVAWVMSRQPELEWQHVKARLLAAVRPVDSLIGLTLTGGVLNLANAGDCNRNGIGDEVDIAVGTSLDCTGNGVPDECEPDCNTNGIADSCDVVLDGLEDCNSNVIPDECEPDCNDNGVADSCDVLGGTSENCGYEDMVPDECEPDCNNNGTPDSCDLLRLGPSDDCNNNRVPDECDLADGTSEDENGNQRPDECDTIVYVDAAAPAGGDGTSWATAYNDLQDALPMSHLTEIWVAAGTYKPAGPDGDRAVGFRVLYDHRMFGGFAGDETRCDQRDLATNVTILSGDLNGDDGPDWTNRDDNSYHVLSIDIKVNSGIIDGFTIIGGNADGVDPDGWGQRGGGILFDEEVVTTLSNCIITGNSAERGGGMYGHNKAWPVIADCTFTGNRALASGGALYIAGDVGDYIKPVLTHCVFSDNSAVEGGGAIYDDNRPVALDNCLFTGNTAEEGGALHLYSSETTLGYCTLEGNSATKGGAIYSSFGDPELTDCTLIGNSATWGGGFYSGYLGDPVLTHSVFIGNSATNEGGGAWIGGGASAVLGCRFYDNQARDGAGLYLSNNDATLGNCIFSGNSADRRGGGMYFKYLGNSAIANSVFTGNWAYYEGGGVHIAGPVGTEDRVRMDNCILWGSSTHDGQDEVAQIQDVTGELYLNYSCVQGWTGTLGGTGNIGDDPLLVDAVGQDDTPGTPDDDLHLMPASPCIDAGDNTAVPAEVTSDMDGHPRFVDYPVAPDTGYAPEGGPVVDMGPYELYDCNGNGIRDDEEIAAGTAGDCNENGMPDECDPDCNENLSPDECDIASGTSTDVDDSGVPDECEGICVPADAPQAEVEHVAKNRYLSIVGGDPPPPSAIRVILAGLPPPHDVANGRVMWVGQPKEYCENAGQDLPPPDGCGPAPGAPSRTFWGAALQCDPYYGAWSTYDTVQVYDESIVPGGSYILQGISAGCDMGLQDNYSAPLELTTSLWGDIVRNCITTPCGPPDGVVNITTDVSAVVDKFRNLNGAPIKSRCDLEPGQPDLLINVSDATEVLDAFRGLGYPFPVPDPCP